MKKLIKYHFQKLYKFFLWASGADLEILKEAPTDEINTSALEEL